MMSLKYFPVINDIYIKDPFYLPYLRLYMINKCAWHVLFLKLAIRFGYGNWENSFKKVLGNVTAPFNCFFSYFLCFDY
jgi:hypothetical protein